MPLQFSHKYVSMPHSEACELDMLHHTTQRHIYKRRPLHASMNWWGRGNKAPTPWTRCFSLLLLLEWELECAEGPAHWEVTCMVIDIPNHLNQNPWRGTTHIRLSTPPVIYHVYPLFWYPPRQLSLKVKAWMPIFHFYKIKHSPSPFASKKELVLYFPNPNEGDQPLIGPKK